MADRVRYFQAMPWLDVAFYSIYFAELLIDVASSTVYVPDLAKHTSYNKFMTERSSAVCICDNPDQCRIFVYYICILYNYHFYFYLKPGMTMYYRWNGQRLPNICQIASFSWAQTKNLRSPSLHKCTLGKMSPLSSFTMFSDIFYDKV